MNEKPRNNTEKYAINAKDVYYNENYPDTIPEDKNESCSQINQSLIDFEKRNKLNTSVKTKNTAHFPSPRKTPQRPLSRRSDDEMGNLDSVRRTLEYKPQGKTSQNQINYYANDYDYYEMRLTQREKSFSPEDVKQQDQDNSSKNNENNDKSELNASYLYDLQTTINNSKPHDTIILPDHSVRVYQLKINKPLTIVGSPSSSIDVSHSIQIDLSGYGKTSKGVIFSECCINFEFLSRKSFLNQSLSTRRSKESEEYKLGEKVSYSEHNQTNFLTGQLTTERSQNSDRVYPLFIVNPGSLLDLRDCHISSKNTAGQSPVFQDVCFYLNQFRSNPQENQPCLRVQSTVVNNFFMAVQNSICCKLYIEKLFVSNNHSHAINISNPHILSIKECVITNPGKSCINIRFSKEIFFQESRYVRIERNELCKGSYGISIFGENITPQSCTINITENRICQNTKDGIGMKNLNISKVTIEKNQIVDNGGNGLFLNHVLDTTNFLQVNLKENKILESRLYGLAISEVAVFSDKDEIMRNHKGGVLLTGQEKVPSEQEIEFFKSYPLRNIFSTTKINNNKDSGFQIIGNLRGPLIFNSCEFYENMNGLFIKQEPLNSTAYDEVINKTAKKLILEDQIFGDVVLEKCVLFQNRLSGIHIKSINTKLYLRETTISENRNYAMFIESQQDKEKIVFKESDKGKVREHVSGHIGGNWGILYETNTASCKGNKCTIF